MIELLAAAFVLGLGVTPHCALMCGPVAARACAAPHGGMSAKSSAGYISGRITSYLLVGAIVGTLGGGMLATVSSPLRIVAIELVALFLLAEGFRLIAPQRFAGGSLGRVSQELARRLPKSGLGLGLATGLFPCGALVSAVLLASISGGGLPGAAVMVTFSVASFPGVLAPALAFGWFSRGRGDWDAARFAKMGGAALIVLAVWVAARPLSGSLGVSKESHCEHVSAPQLELNEESIGR